MLLNFAAQQCCVPKMWRCRMGDFEKLIEAAKGMDTRRMSEPLFTAKPSLSTKGIN
jgi:hypothetical protein